MAAFVVIMASMFVGTPGSQAFDRLVHALYKHHRAVWDASGKPNGVFWSAPECRWPGSLVAKQKLGVRLLFKTPAWVAEDADLRVSIWQMRVCNAVIAALLVGFLVYQLR